MNKRREKLIEYVYQAYEDIGIARNRIWAITDESDLYLAELANTLTKIKLLLKQLKKN